MAPRQRWAVGLALLFGAGGLLAATRLLPPVEAGRPASVPRLAACATPVHPGANAAARPGTFFKVQATLDAAGVLAGQHLVVGRAGQARASVELPSESSVAGPVGGIVVVASDDGRRSTLELVDVAAGCRSTAYTTDAVIRRAILDPADGSLLFHVIARAARDDLGTWRLARGAALPQRVVDPLPATFGLGLVWGTELRLDPSSRLLAVQSCLDRGCITRIIDLGSPRLPAIVVRGSRQGPIVGFTGDRLVTWAACDGFPCAVLGWDLASSTSSELLADASAAALTGNGRLLVAMAGDASGNKPVVLDLATGTVRPLRGTASGDLPIPVGALAGLGLEVDPDQVGLAPRVGDPHAIRPTAAGEVLP